jgi:hypothetical protein
VKRRDDTAMGVISVPTLTLQCVVLETLRSAPVIQMDKQPFKLLTEKYAET